ncbi:MAG: hypothetical protein P8Y47_13615 [Alphaproteobacteria bacterium]
MNIDQITRIAQQLNIKLTAAEEGTDLYRCWADRVEDAWRARQRGDTDRCREMIEDANRYAV